MVDTSLRPRPTFGTFLQSDNSTSDGLSYYEYQRLLRSKKVALLQEKRRRSYEPGYKKPDASSNSTGPLSRMIFQLKSKNSPKLKLSCEGKNSQADEAPLEAESKPLLHQVPFTVNPDDSLRARKNENNGSTQIQTDRLPRIKAKDHMIKCATARDHLHSSSHAQVLGYEHPKTVCGERDADLHDLDEFLSEGIQTDPLIGKQESWPLTLHKHPFTESSTKVVDLEEPAQNEIDMLARAYTWRTSSQRATNEVGWKERMPSPSVPHPASTIEQFPDPVSMRLTFRRYHSEPAEWQCIGTEWDSAQSRPGSSNIARRFQSLSYSSSNRKIQQIPGYYGHIPNYQLKDGSMTNCQPTTLVRSTTPKATSSSRKANIPGYTGCVCQTSAAPAHNDMSLPELTTSARIHRHIPLEEERSPFVRAGVFSKMIKTVSPYNPYNKIDYNV